MFRSLRLAWYSRRLRKGSDKSRADAATQLAALGGDRVVQMLIAALGDDGYKVREAVVQGLGILGDSRAVMPLLKLLNDDCCRHREGVINALAELGDRRAVEPLIKTLSTDVRATAATALAKLGEAQWATWIRGEWADFERLGRSSDPKSCEILSRIVTGKESHNHRAAAATGLRYVGAACALAPLVSALRDPWGNVRSAAAESLGELGDKRAVGPLIDVLSSDVRGVAAAALAKLGEVQWATWIRGDSDDIERLGRSGDPRALLVLIRLLHPGTQIDNPSHRSSSVRSLNINERERVIAFLGASGDERAIPSLVAQLDDCTHIREAATAALVRIGTPAVFQQFLDVLDSDRSKSPCRNPVARIAAAYGLAELGDPRAVDPLIKVLQQRRSWTDPELTIAAVTALGVYAPPGAVEPLLEAIPGGTPDRRTEEVIVAALVAIGEPAAASLLATMQTDGRCMRSRKVVAAKALVKMMQGPNPSSTALRHAGVIRSSAVSPHEDRYFSHTPSDCGSHTDTHTDRGVGLDPSEIPAATDF